jgi:hypothetical protein
MLLASKAGGFMDNAVLAVDGGRNMVNSTMRVGSVRLGELMNRWPESTMEFHYLMRLSRGFTRI